MVVWNKVCRSQRDSCNPTEERQHAEQYLLLQFGAGVLQLSNNAEVHTRAKHQQATDFDAPTTSQTLCL